MTHLIREAETAGAMMPGAYFVTNAITERTTPDEFDQILASPEAARYRLNHGGRCNWTAMDVAFNKVNIRLVQHLIDLGRQQGLDILNLDGCRGTPLMRTAYCPNPEAGLRIAQALIDGGADVNVCSWHQGRTYTPLLDAAKMGDIRRVRLFLQHGAFIPSTPEDCVHTPCWREEVHQDDAEWLQNHD